ncbi:hypothetical protein APHAL10511_007613 [Amanita phalloides]|nr:hypothetical protein APHAL10511_007613 [Amanita phalloides]
MSQFHLRPVSDNSPSSSPTASTSSPDRSSPHKTSPVSSSSHYSNARPRRPLSPSSIRDLDLTHTSDMPQRKYPAPPTGHELMAMFPPAPPETPLETRGGPTSGFFQRQERAFFAQAGKEIFRVRVEIDLPHASDMEGGHVKPRPRDVNARSWPPQLPVHPPPNAPISHHSPVHAANPPVPLANPNGISNQRGGVPVTPVPLYPVNTHSPTSQHPPNLHTSPVHQAGMTLRTPPQEPIPAASQRPKTEFQPEEFDPDEAWRRPIPYAERRRAGKHTKRVIVRT